MNRRLPAAILVFCFGASVFLFLLFVNFYPIRGLFKNSIAESTKIYDRNGILLYETLNPEQGKTTEIPLSQIPKNLVKATIAAEDSSFYENSGIDIGGILRAIFLNVKEGRIVSGGSTITQQLARNVIGVNKERTFFQKIKESLLALRVTKVFSKDEILEMYFNKVYYGNLNYGAAAASRGYFGREVSGLDLAECAFLAGLPQAPNRYDPFKNSEDALKRKNYVLSLMREKGFISKEEMADAQNEELSFEQNLTVVRAPHFVQYVIEELDNRFGENYVSAGLEVKTTLDYNLQQKIQEIAERNLNLLAGRNVTNAAVVVLDPKTSEIVAMLGSIDYFNKEIDGQVNVALSQRQPGSAMKPITYAVAFEKGWNAATLILDSPVRFFTAEGTPYLPKNYDYEYHGLVTVREALANSYNIPAVKTIDFTGVESVLEKAREMGLQTLTKSADHYGLALTLGDAEVRLLDLTSVYMVFANYGLKKNPSAISEIKSADSKIIYEKKPDAGERMLPENISFMVTDILSDNGARIPEFGLNNVLELDREAAVKTGTTRNFRDNWTFGYTQDYVVGVWVGNSDNSAMHRITGIYGAGPIWHDIMQEIHRGKEKKKFRVPSGVMKKEFCVEEISGGKCAKTVSEWIPKSAYLNRTKMEQEEKPKLRITKPFDYDEFQFMETVDKNVQQIKFQAEKDASIGEVTWLVNGEKIGLGDAVFWQIKKGDFQIQAEAGGIFSEPVRIFVN